VLNGEAGRPVGVADIERAVRLSRRVGVLAFAVCAAGRLAASRMKAVKAVKGRKS
jgi:adenosylcobinamide-phosphate synthase